MPGSRGGGMGGTIVVVWAVALAALAPGAFGRVRHSSLYSGPGSRPGPSILYSGPAVASQLTNAGIWRAQPILVSGTEAYRAGEFLYQDFLYDDHGAHGVPDPNDTRMSGDLFSKPGGTYTYPTAPGYAN